MEIFFDPQEYIRGIQNVLVSDKKRIAFLFGAGTSNGFVPLIFQMTSKIVDLMNSEKNEYKIILEKIKIRINSNPKLRYNIETILSQIDQIIEFAGDDGFNGIAKSFYEDLGKRIKDEIIKQVSAHKKIEENEAYDTLTHTNFAEWIGEASRKYPIEIFTTNYDYLFELGLEQRNIPYYDGFKGSYNPFFFADSIEDLNCYHLDTKLWKVHGSLGWKIDEKNNKIVRSKHDDNKILIFPSIQKYQESKKQPYISFLDRLYNFLKENDTILFTCGYSFSDEHINERIISALNSNTTAHVVALYFDEIRKLENGKTIIEYLLKKDDELYKLAMKQSKISAYGMRNAVIGCKYGKWKLNREPDIDESIKLDLYYEEDFFDSEVELNKIKKGEEKFTGEGRFILPDFIKFIDFLKSMVIEDEIMKNYEFKSIKKHE